MTLLLMEGFDHYFNYTRKGWQGLGPSGTSPVDTTQVLNGGRVAALGGRHMKIGVQSSCGIGACNTDRSIYKLFPASTEVIAGFGLWTDSNWPLPGQPFMILTDVNLNPILSFRFTGSQLPDLGGVAQSTNPHTHGVWTYYEVRLKINGASGECELYRDGAPDIATAVANFGTAPVGGIQFHTFASGNNTEKYYYVDDVYVINTQGAAPRNTFLGDVRVETLYPTGEGAHLDWAPNAGTTHYTQVDEHDPNDDTDYVSSNTPNAIDSYVFSDLASAGVVYGVQCNMVARKTTAGFKQLKHTVRGGGVDYEGAVKTMAAAYNWYGHIFETDPAGGEWTTAKVNADEYGVKVVT